ncbi:ATP-binding protein, partial [Fusobacterium polymorphum]
MNFLIFLLSTDYILSHSFICLGLPTSTSFG